MTIQEHIDLIKDDLKDPTISPQRRRHLSNELNDLLLYQKENPESDKDVSSLELYCWLNPSAIECKIFNL